MSSFEEARLRGRLRQTKQELQTAEDELAARVAELRCTVSWRENTTPIPPLMISTGSTATR
jgi:hypothetical protein